MERNTVRSVLIVSVVLVVAMGMMAAPLAGVLGSSGVVAADEGPEEEDGPDEGEGEVFDGPDITKIFTHAHYDGTGEIQIGFDYQFESEEEFERYVEVANDPEVEEEVAASFEEDMRDVAEETPGFDADDITGSEAALAYDQEQQLGHLDIWVEWDGMVEVDVENRQLVVTEPYASGFGPHSDAVQNAGLPDDAAEYVGVEPQPVKEVVVQVPELGHDYFASTTPEPDEEAEMGHAIGFYTTDSLPSDFEVRIDVNDQVDLGEDAPAPDESLEDTAGDDSSDSFLAGATGTYLAWSAVFLALGGIIAGSVYFVKRRSQGSDGTDAGDPGPGNE